jgi:membrane protease YdiL (CAAX protease family)
MPNAGSSTQSTAGGSRRVASFVGRTINPSPGTVTIYQHAALLLTGIWLLLIAVRFRRSVPVLIGGLCALGLVTLAAFACGGVTPGDLGLGTPRSWQSTLGFSLMGLGLMLAYSPFADWLAARWIDQPPNLEAFRALQQSRAKFIAGIVVAWVLGGVLEELVLRGIVLRSVDSVLTAWLGEPIASAVAVSIAALGAGVIHLYQGHRAVVIIAQLSILFGVLFIVSGNNLWAVMLCHGLYDTIAFVRFATKKSRYAKLD